MGQWSLAYLETVATQTTGRGMGGGQDELQVKVMEKNQQLEGGARASLGGELSEEK